MDGNRLKADDVRAWLETVRAELATVNAKMQPLLDEQARLEEREALLHNLIQSFDKANEATSNSTSTHAAGSVGEYVVEQAVAILREVGTPLHINDLHAIFRERGLKIPGAGAPANLIVHLRKSPEIASPQRGIYALTELVGTIQRTKKPARRTTRRRKKAR